MVEHEKLNNPNRLGNFKNKKDVFDFLRKQSGEKKIILFYTGNSLED